MPNRLLSLVVFASISEYKKCDLYASIYCKTKFKLIKLWILTMTVIKHPTFITSLNNCWWLSQQISNYMSTMFTLEVSILPSSESNTISVLLAKYFMSYDNKSVYKHV